MPSSACVNKALIGLGATEIVRFPISSNEDYRLSCDSVPQVLGVGVLGCGVICTVEKSRLHELYHGLWGGAIFAAIGLLAVLGL